MVTATAMTGTTVAIARTLLARGTSATMKKRRMSRSALTVVRCVPLILRDIARSESGGGFYRTILWRN